MVISDFAAMAVGDLLKTHRGNKYSSVLALLKLKLPVTVRGEMQQLFLWQKATEFIGNVVLNVE